MERISFPLAEVLEVLEVFYPPDTKFWIWVCRICEADGADGFVSTQQGAERIGILHLKAFHGANELDPEGANDG